MLSLMLFASDYREVNFFHQTMELTLTAAEMFISKLTVLTDFLANHILDISHVPKFLISRESISESVPVEEVRNEPQPASQVLVEDLVC